MLLIGGGNLGEGATRGTMVQNLFKGGGVPGADPEVEEGGGRDTDIE